MRARSHRRFELWACCSEGKSSFKRLSNTFETVNENKSLGYRRANARHPLGAVPVNAEERLVPTHSQLLVLMEVNRSDRSSYFHLEFYEGRRCDPPAVAFSLVFKRTGLAVLLLVIPVQKGCPDVLVQSSPKSVSLGATRGLAVGFGLLVRAGLIQRGHPPTTM